MNKDKHVTIGNAGGGGIGFSGLLTIVFVVLKLVGVISWSWFWVFSPLIFSTAIGLIFLIIVIILILRNNI